MVHSTRRMGFSTSTRMPGTGLFVVSSSSRRVRSQRKGLDGLIPQSVGRFRKPTALLMAGALALTFSAPSAPAHADPDEPDQGVRQQDDQGCPADHLCQPDLVQVDRGLPLLERHRPDRRDWRRTAPTGRPVRQAADGRPARPGPRARPVQGPNGAAGPTGSDRCHRPHGRDRCRRVLLVTQALPARPVTRVPQAPRVPTPPSRGRPARPVTRAPTGDREPPVPRRYGRDRRRWCDRRDGCRLHGPGTDWRDR